MPIDLQTYNKQCVEDLFANLVTRLTIRGVDAYVTDVLHAEDQGGEAIQIQSGTAQLTSDNLGFAPAELVFVFLNQYIKLVVSSHPVKSCNLSVHKFKPWPFSNLEITFQITIWLQDCTISLEPCNLLECILICTQVLKI